MCRSYFSDPWLDLLCLLLYTLFFYFSFLHCHLSQTEKFHQCHWEYSAVFCWRDLTCWRRIERGPGHLFRVASGFNWIWKLKARETNKGSCSWKTRSRSLYFFAVLGKNEASEWTFSCATPAVVELWTDFSFLFADVLEYLQCQAGFLSLVCTLVVKTLVQQSKTQTWKVNLSERSFVVLFSLRSAWRQAHHFSTTSTSHRQTSTHKSLNVGMRFSSIRSCSFFSFSFIWGFIVSCLPMFVCLQSVCLSLFLPFFLLIWPIDRVTVCSAGKRVCSTAAAFLSHLSFSYIFATSVLVWVLTSNSLVFCLSSLHTFLLLLFLAGGCFKWVVLFCSSRPAASNLLFQESALVNFFFFTPKHSHSWRCWCVLVCVCLSVIRRFFLRLVPLNCAVECRTKQQLFCTLNSCR